MSGRLTPGEEVRLGAPEREKRVRIEPLGRARNLLGFATFQAAKAGLYYSAADRGPGWDVSRAAAGLISPEPLGPMMAVNL